MAAATSDIHALFDQAPRATIICRDCGVGFVHHGRRGRLPERCAACTAVRREKAPAKHLVACWTCGKREERRRPARYCSRSCQRKSQPARSGKSRMETRSCRACLEQFTARRDNDRVFCSDVCSKAWRAALAKPPSYRVRIRRSPLSAPCVCRGCGGVYVHRRYGRGLCPPCHDRAKQEARAKTRAAFNASGARAAARKARKLRLRGVSVEHVNPLKVLERDRWTCQLCGIRTPKRLRGTYDDLAPEVDHIVPIAEGGEHSYRNVQCACRKCNLNKSGSAKGQLRLFG